MMLKMKRVLVITVIMTALAVEVAACTASSSSETPEVTPEPTLTWERIGEGPHGIEPVFATCDSAHGVLIYLYDGKITAVYRPNECQVEEKK